MSDRDCERDSFLDALRELGPLRGIKSVPSAGLTAAEGVVWRGLYAGTSGDVTIETEEGQTIELKSLAAGMWHGVVFRRVIAGFTAANLLVGR